jgi:hypothetical protein
MLRKGQKLCNWILMKGYTNETVHAKLFNMSDAEFDMVMDKSWEELTKNNTHDFLKGLPDATPALKGKEAEEFIKKMIRTEKRKPNKREMEMFRRIMFMADGRPRCHHCGRVMFNVKDRTTGKMSEYEWKCDCPDFPKNIVIGVL